MSTQATHSNKTKQLPAAVVIAMSASSSAYAVNFGQTSIESTQYQPLSATIEVNGITSKDFDISLASAPIYSQMGLTQNGNIKARFERTSAETGRLVLTSSQPINEPFADIVLNIDNSEKKQFMPKTLLMPVANKPAPSQQNQPKQLVNQPKARPNLPVTQGLPPNNNIPSNTAVRMFESSEDTRRAFSYDQAKAQGNAPANTNRNAKDMAKRQGPSNPPQMLASAGEPPIGQLPSDRLLLQDSNSVRSENKQTKRVQTKRKPVQAKRKPVQTKKRTVRNKQTKQRVSVNASKSTYIVQRNDNLWTISLEIAKQNKLNVHTVMKQIQQLNPKAFINGRANRIIAKSKLVLPDYKVIPSQSSLEQAIQMRQKNVAKVMVAKKAKKQVQQVAKTSTKTKKRIVKKPTVTKTQSKKTKVTSVKPTQTQKRVSLVAPSKNTKAKQQASSSRGNLISKLKKTRKNTAADANRVNALNSKVSTYTQKLKLQNQKLAELEARLKKLKGK